MKCLKMFLVLIEMMALLYVGEATARAQDPQDQGENNNKPKPAARTYLPLIFDDQNPSGDQDSAPPRQPDMLPLTGIQNPTLGTPEFRHSYWVPGFQYSNIVSSNALNQPAASGWNSTSYLVGNLSLLEAWSRSLLSVNYTGGAFFPTDSGIKRGHFHQFGLNQKFDWGRWQLAVLDEFFYLPDSPFGFGGGTGVSIPGIGGSLGTPLPGLGGFYQPNQTVLTVFGTRYGNDAATEVSYRLSRRSLINIAGSYGLLRFLQAGNIESNEYGANVGYDYALGKRDTLGVLYRFTAFRFIGNAQALNDHAVHISYGRKITGRLALRVSGGPEITNFSIPIGTVTRQIGESVDASLDYGMEHTNLFLTYARGVSNGSGIQAGSSSDRIQMGLSRQLSPGWKSNMNFGFARNGNLGNLALGQAQQTYGSYYIGGNLYHALGREASLSIAYTTRFQTSNKAVCVAGTCSKDYTENQITLGFSWHARPFVLR